MASLNDFKMFLMHVDDMSRKIKFTNRGVQQVYESIQNFVIVGANGSGKSHLGAAIEKEMPNDVLRISAQRALTIPDRVEISDYESTWRILQFGNSQKNNKAFKWGDKTDYTIKLIDDYRTTLSSVFSFQNEQEHKYCNKSNEIIAHNGVVREGVVRITDDIRAIWDTVFPQRQLVFESAKVNASYEGNAYQAKYMSDGERVALYLISQCLLAPKNTIVIVDEPEIHLHRTIMSRLWDAIEQYCPDITFVYITHDLEFAVGRKNAKKIWVKAFNGEGDWDLEEIPDSEKIPEGLMMEVIGNRKPVLFVEGNKGSYDYQLYSQVYEDRYVIPAHNCLKVIELTKAFNNDDVKSVHHLDVKGIVDRDYLSEEEIEAYKEWGIVTLNVAEVENLFLLEPVVKLVAEHLGKDPDDIFTKVSNFVFKEFEKERDCQLKELCARYISFKLQQYEKPKGNELQDLKDGINSTVKKIDVDNIYAKYNNEINEILKNRDYNRLLRIYNRKSLSERVSSIFGLANKTYPVLVLNLLKTVKRKEIIAALKKELPNAVVNDSEDGKAVERKDMAVIADKIVI